MELYFSPLSCSLATRIALYEIGAEPETQFHQVTLSTKRFDHDNDYWPIAPKGQVPALLTREGQVLTENPAVLQYVADLKPESRLAPARDSFERYRLQQWLNFISTEIHKQIFAVMFNPTSPPEAKAYVAETVLPQKFAYLSAELQGREYLLQGGFTVADAYLLTTLNWCAPANIDLGQWPALQSYHQRITQRPAVARAIREEMVLAGRA